MSGNTGVCIIGTGRAGMIHARNFDSGRVGGAEVVALCDPCEQTLEAGLQELDLSAGYRDYRRALEDDRVNAVVIATPTTYHRDAAVAAAEAGKHAFCEKPMAINPTQCREMIEAARRAEVKLQIGFMRRFDESFLRAKRFLDEGKVGAVACVRSITHGPSTPRAWMYDLGKSNGPLAEVNSHDIDTLRWLTGSEFELLYAVGGNYRCPQAREQYPDFYDNVSVVARFENGAQGTIGGAQGVRYGYDARCEILGRKGLITVGRIGTDSVGLYTAGGTSSPVPASWRNLFEEAYLAEDRDFIACIAEDRSPRVSGADGLEAVRVVEAGNRSIVERRAVRLEEV